MAKVDSMMQPRKNLTKSMNTKSSLTMGEPSMTPNQKGSQMYLKDTRISMCTCLLHASMMDAIMPDW